MPVVLVGARVVDRDGEGGRLRVQVERRRIVEYPTVLGAQRTPIAAGLGRERDGDGAVHIGRPDLHAPVFAEHAPATIVVPVPAAHALRLHDLPVGDGKGVIAHVPERNKDGLAQPEIEAVVETPALAFHRIERLERRGDGRADDYCLATDLDFDWTRHESPRCSSPNIAVIPPIGYAPPVHPTVVFCVRCGNSDFRGARCPDSLEYDEIAFALLKSRICRRLVGQLSHTRHTWGRQRIKPAAGGITVIVGVNSRAYTAVAIGFHIDGYRRQRVVLAWFDREFLGNLPNCRVTPDIREAGRGGCLTEIADQGPLGLRPGRHCQRCRQDQQARGCEQRDRNPSRPRPGSSAFGVRRSAFGVRRSAFGVRRSAFGVRRSAFGVRRSAFGVRRSAFGVRRSAFGVRRSAFGVRRSAFNCADSRFANNVKFFSEIGTFSAEPGNAPSRLLRAPDFPLAGNLRRWDDKPKSAYRTAHACRCSAIQNYDPRHRLATKHDRCSPYKHLIDHPFIPPSDSMFPKIPHGSAATIARPINLECCWLSVILPETNFIVILSKCRFISWSLL